MNYIYDLLIKNFLPWLDSIWNSIEFWRSSALILLLFIGLIWSFREKLTFIFMNPGRLEHDKKIFIQADQILPEKHILIMIRELNNSHSYFRESIDSPYKFLNFFNETSNQFIDKRLKLKLEEFADGLDILLSFMGTNFWEYPPGQKRDNPIHCLYPDLNIDRGGEINEKKQKQYADYAIELRRLTQNVEASYKSYRTHIQKEMNL